MLTMILLLAAAYLIHKWGFRLQMRGTLFGQAGLVLASYLCSLASGTFVSLAVTVNVLDLLMPSLGVWQVSLLSTALSVGIGEILHLRGTRLSVRLLAPLRSKEQER